jgi:hypothetical protein
VLAVRLNLLDFYDCLDYPAREFRNSFAFACSSSAGLSNHSISFLVLRWIGAGCVPKKGQSNPPIFNGLEIPVSALPAS